MLQYLAQCPIVIYFRILLSELLLLFSGFDLSRFPSVLIRVKLQSLVSYFSSLVDVLQLLSQVLHLFLSKLLKMSCNLTFSTLKSTRSMSLSDLFL